MARARTFSKAEIMDAARAAAEQGIPVRLTAGGDIVFNAEPHPEAQATKPTFSWDKWKSGWEKKP